MITLRIVRKVTELIGRTPLLSLCQDRSGSRLLLKLEQFNPLGTAKTRMALEMVRDAERRGALRPGGHIIESTSGNTGLGLALVAAERGYRFTAVVDGHACPDKLRAMRAMGAELVYVTGDGDGELATAAREDLAARLAKDTDGAVFTEQHNNPGNAEGYRPLARELAEALPEGVDYLIGAVGTGGSLCGTGRELRRTTPHTRIVGVEPVGSIAFGGPGGPYHQSGTGTPPGAPVGALVDFDLIDEGRKVSDRQAFGAARALARRTGLLVGGSAGGVVYEALRLMTAVPARSTVVAVLNDTGEKYLDTVFDDGWMAGHDLLDPTVEREVDDLLTRLSQDPDQDTGQDQDAGRRRTRAGTRAAGPDQETGRPGPRPGRRPGPSARRT
ncbi:PLP-dependent cysteine synthase family protein [Streptosporangium minutum]|uniref:PLP-dependent cysteine synthase family protein n=1 Tax=Streptosporangium minutum TaxID=569862 RepID=UPI001F60D0DD|nr:cysteine synthase family protein [Streptosporangium minutum]